MLADPCIPEALKMFEHMTSKHTRELACSELVWDKTYEDGELLLALPRLILTFKYS